MNIHIHTLGIDRNVEEECRITLLGNKFLVRLRYRLIEIWRAEEATIYEHILLARIVTSCLGATNITLYRGDGCFDLHLQQVASCGITHNADNALHER